MFEDLEYEEGVQKEANSLFDLTLGVMEELFLKKLRHNSSHELVSKKLARIR